MKMINFERSKCELDFVYLQNQDQTSKRVKSNKNTSTKMMSDFHAEKKKTSDLH